MPLLTIKNICLHDVGPVSLVVDEGECVAISGESGSGKTLLFRAISDLEPHSGDVFLDGIDQRDVPAPKWRKQVAYLPTESHWWYEHVGEHFDVDQNAVDQHEVDQRRVDKSRFYQFGDLEQGLALLGLDKSLLNWPTSRLSTGERQRLALLRSLSSGPRVLLLDEPSSSLDPSSVVKLESLIASYRKQTKAAVIWIGHDLSQLRRVADRCFSMEHGKLMEMTTAGAEL